MAGVGAVLAVGLTISGCTGDEPAEPEPATTTAEESPEPTEEPEPEPTETGPTKPERPAEMERDDAKGAAAAVEYFVELYPYSMTTGDTSDWEKMSLPGCKTCNGYMDQAATILTESYEFEGGQIDATVEDPEKYFQDATGIYQLDIRFKQEPLTIRNTSGGEEFSSEGGTNDHRAEVVRRDDMWKVVEIGRIPGAES